MKKRRRAAALLESGCRNRVPASTAWPLTDAGGSQGSMKSGRSRHGNVLPAASEMRTADEVEVVRWRRQHRVSSSDCDHHA